MSRANGKSSGAPETDDGLLIKWAALMCSSMHSAKRPATTSRSAVPPIGRTAVAVAVAAIVRQTQGVVSWRAPPTSCYYLTLALRSSSSVFGLKSFFFSLSLSAVCYLLETLGSWSWDC